MTTRVVGIVLLVVGVAATLFGLGARLFWEDDDGHHDGRAPTFAVDAAVGADVLVVEQEGSVVGVSVERAGQRITSFDELHDAPAHVFVVGTDLDSYHHVDMADTSDGVVEFDGAVSGEYRVVFQAAPSSGPDLLELGATVELTGSSGASAGDASEITDSEVWTDGSLTIERHGLDFVLSEPWNGRPHHGGPAFLAVFHADEMAFVHGHAELVDDDLFRFGLDVPGRGDYLAALEFVQDNELVTALFRFTL